MALQAINLTKYYGRQKALDGINFTLKEGEICGFLGPNGAGKSTTMKIISGCLGDYKGKAEVCGIDIRQHPLEAKMEIGYLPEHNPLYTDMYIREYLTHIARLYRMSSPCQKVDSIMEQTGLLPEKRKKIGQLSKGYRQRVGLAQALVHDPQVLILDEPMTGLDPNQLEEIRHLIMHVGKNKTVLLSTHVMQEVEAICDRVIVIHQGRIITDRPKDEMHTLTGKGRIIQVRFAPESKTAWIGEAGIFKSARQLAPNHWQLTAKPGEDPRVQLFEAAVFHHCPIIELKTEEQNLENIFRQLTNQ